MLKNKINKLTSKTRTSLTLNGLSQDSFLLCRCISNEKITITFKLVKKVKDFTEAVVQRRSVKKVFLEIS